MTRGSTTYPVPSYAAGREVLHTLRQRFRTGGGHHFLQPVTWYDTFDWRLFRDGGTLSARPANQGWELLWSSRDGDVRHRLRVDSVPAFARELPPGAFRDALASIVEMRRLLPRVRAEFLGELFQILDSDDHVVALVNFEEGTAAPADGAGAEKRVAPRIQLQPHEDGPEQCREIIAILESELGLQSAPCDQFDRALEAAGTKPAGYSPKLAVTIDAGMRAGEAARLILRSLLRTIQANEDGVRRGLDTEFLHDFRVAVRRTRTCLAQIRGIFPEDRTAHFRGEFRWLGSVTGPTRDLDVHLLEIPTYRALLPAGVRSDLAPLVQFLEKRQSLEHARMVEALESPRYHALIHDWTRLLQEPGGDPTVLKGAGRPIVEVADGRIARRWKRVVKRSRAIRDDTPEEGLHLLRIQCKKLRYLLEFFHSLYPPRELDPLVAKLRKLQDRLGAFNDLRVQRNALRRLAVETFENRSATPESLLAMGRLQEQLQVRLDEQGRRLRRSLSRFTGKKMKARMERLLHREPMRGSC